MALECECKLTRANLASGNIIEEKELKGSGIEENSRANFMVPVEKRDRATLIPLILQWI